MPCRFPLPWVIDETCFVVRDARARLLLFRGRGGQASGRQPSDPGTKHGGWRRNLSSCCQHRHCDRRLMIWLLRLRSPGRSTRKYLRKNSPSQLCRGPRQWQHVISRSFAGTASIWDYLIPGRAIRTRERLRLRLGHAGQCSSMPRRDPKLIVAATRAAEGAAHSCRSTIAC